MQEACQPPSSKDVETEPEPLAQLLGLIAPTFVVKCLHFQGSESF